ncbi:MAG: hypothetical protein OXT65_10255 [Alphaproteobacteria bacterium]|nr:hypothetical protein [Alphaproteobacteria bacterium]
MKYEKRMKGCLKKIGLMICMFVAIMQTAPSYAQITLTKQSDLDMGSVLAPGTFPGTQYQLIGTNSVMQYAAGFSGSGTGTAGSFFDYRHSRR